MIKKFIFIIITSLLLCGCDDQQPQQEVNAKSIEQKSQHFSTINDLEGVRVGVVAGTIAEIMLPRVLKTSEPVYYNSFGDFPIALKANKIDAFIMENSLARLMINAQGGMRILGKSITSDSYAFIFPKEQKELCDAFSAEIDKLRADGTLQKLKERWLSKEYTFPVSLENPPNGTLRYVVLPEMEPFSFYHEGKIVGYDIDLAHMVATKLGYGLKSVVSSGGSFLELVHTNKVNFCAALVTITPEREKMVLFTSPTAESGLNFVVSDHQKTEDEINAIEQLAHKRIGVISGTTVDKLAEEFIPTASVVYINNFADLPIALNHNKVDAFFMEKPQADLMLHSVKNMKLLDEQLTFDDYAFLFAKNDEKLCHDFSVEIEKLKKDGTLEKLSEKWFAADQSLYKMEEPLKDPPNGVLKIATCPLVAPFSFLFNDKIIGFDIEVATIVANKLGYGVELISLDFSALLETVSSKKASVGVGCITITEERKKAMLFSEPTYKGGIVIVVKKTSTGDEEINNQHKFWDNLKDSFNSTFFVEDRYKLILEGLTITVIISLFSAIFGTILGFFICCMRLSKNSFVNVSAKIYIRLIQGMPMLVILMILYYIIFGSVDIDATLVAIIGFTLNFAAYTSEMMRTGISAVDRGQIDAASAMGFSKIQVFFKIIFPQAARYVLPVYKGEFIAMVKMTSVVGYIAIQDLTKMSDIIRSRTYEAFFPLILTALIYFILSYSFTIILSLIEWRIDPKHRKRIVKNIIS